MAPLLWLLHASSVLAMLLCSRLAGVVVSALNSTTGRKVAIKKIPNWTADLTDAKRILREVKLMRHFDHENVGGGSP